MDIHSHTWQGYAIKGNLTLIEGGFYLKARCIQNADIAEASPHIREIWDWLIKEANHTTVNIRGTLIQRGQVFTSYDEIRNGLKWKIGYRYERYTKWECEAAMKYLTKHEMITTERTTRGFIITIYKYDYYQTVTNYENHKHNHTRTTREPQSRHTINKNDKNDKNERSKELKDTIEFILPADINHETWDAFIEMRKFINFPLTEKAKVLIINKLNAIGQDKNAVLNQSIENSYRGVFPLKDIGGSNGTGTYSRGSAGKVTQGSSGARNLGDGEAYPVDCEETII